MDFKHDRNHRQGPRGKTPDRAIAERPLRTELQPTVIRIDWAVATQGPTAGFPGRFTAGFTQAF